MRSYSHLTRRDLLKATIQGSAGLAITSLGGCSRQQPAATQPAAGPVSPGARLGLDTYTVHRCLTAKDPALRRDLWWLIDRLPELGLTGLQIDPSHFPGQDEPVLKRLAAAVAPREDYVEFGMGGWTVERLQERIRLTSRFGGRATRTFCGDERSTPEQIAFFLEAAPPALRQAADTAEQYGVDIAVENHGDLTGPQLKALLDAVGHPRVGVCFDTGNSLFRKEDPIECARILAPYARSMHLKDWHMAFDADGHAVWTEAVLGEGQVPIKEVVRIVLNEQPDLYIAVETPVRPGEDEAETVRREWSHTLASAQAARQILAEV